ncbi:MAG: hypothetical protein IJ780_02805 [Neisseriaceae bacterium]|nr:hypothetical protein [Neisseriaceae bacterium]MBR1819045.1 hypothetical protein [Neisseriaceae bacterium]
MKKNEVSRINWIVGILIAAELAPYIFKTIKGFFDNIDEGTFIAAWLVLGFSTVIITLLLALYGMAKE